MSIVIKQNKSEHVKWILKYQETKQNFTLFSIFYFANFQLPVSQEINHPIFMGVMLNVVWKCLRQPSRKQKNIIHKTPDSFWLIAQ